jgi:hypothetical protein
LENLKCTISLIDVPGFEETNDEKFIKSIMASQKRTKVTPSRVHEPQKEMYRNKRVKTFIKI